MFTEASVDRLATGFASVPGVIGVAHGGTRTRSDLARELDADLLLYYDADALDHAALARAVADLVGPDADAPPPGSLGPWLDAEAHWHVDGGRVACRLRDWGRVLEQWERAQAGQYAFQPAWGRPLGYLDVAYAAELALSRVSADPSGVLTTTRQATRHYPRALGRAMRAGLAEVDVLLTAARKAARRDDVPYVALCLARAIMLMAHAILATDRVWAPSAGGLVELAAQRPSSPSGFAVRANDITAHIGSSSVSLRSTLADARRLLEDVRRRLPSDEAAP